jgi:glycosyltransferase involved in cell wall biosynthesis
MDRDSSRRKLGLPRNAVIFLFLGRMAKEKGVDFVARIADHPRCRGMHFLFVGAGPMLKEIESLNQLENVHVVGEIANRDAIYYYNAADALIWGSVDDDYLGRVTIEALACGLPVILPDETDYFSEYQPVRIELPEEIGCIVARSEGRVVELLQDVRDGKRRFDREACRKYAFTHYGPENGEIIFQTYFEEGV